MVRYLFDGGEQVVDELGNARLSLPFTVYTAKTGGDDVTGDMRAEDSETTVAVQTSPTGEVPYLRGPEDARGPLYRDMGTGTRSPWYSAQAIAELVAEGSLDEAAVAAMFAGSHNGANVTYNAETKQLTITVTAGGGGGTTLTSYVSQVASLPDYPVAIAAGSTTAAARAAIGAGTSNLALGTSGTTAKAGNYAPSQTEVLAVAPYQWRTYNETTGVYGARPAVPAGVPVLVSTALDQDAPVPSGASRGDLWFPHPLSPHRPGA